jgi:hypothetical protein
MQEKNSRITEEATSLKGAIIKNEDELCPSRGC